MKKQQKAESAKKSNTPAKPARPKLRITDESTLVVTIYEQGAFKCYGYDKEKSKKQRRKLRQKGRDFRPPCEYHEVKTQITIPNSGVAYAVSEEARPAKMGQSFWKNKPIHEKIELYLSKLADGRKFTWELLN
jgi:hypothetical protein